MYSLVTFRIEDGTEVKEKRYGDWRVKTGVICYLVNVPGRGEVLGNIIKSEPLDDMFYSA